MIRMYTGDKNEKYDYPNKAVPPAILCINARAIEIEISPRMIAVSPKNNNNFLKEERTDAVNFLSFK